MSRGASSESRPSRCRIFEQLAEADGSPFLIVETLLGLQEEERIRVVVNHFAGDIEHTRARVMYAVQQPLAPSAFTDVMGAPLWRSLPSWYLVAQNDEAIPPDAERQFAARMGATTVEVPSGHVAMVSHAQEVTDLIAQAARQTAKPPTDVTATNAMVLESAPDRPTGRPT